MKLSQKLDSSETTQAYYAALPVLKNHILELEKYRATRKVVDRVEQVELNLRRSFSDKVNGQIYDYAKG